MAVTHADWLTHDLELHCAAKATALITFRIAHDVRACWLAEGASTILEALNALRILHGRTKRMAIGQPPSDRACIGLAIGQDIDGRFPVLQRLAVLGN